MITASDMIDKVGKKKFIEMATHSQPKQTAAYLEKQKRWGKASQKYCATCKGWFSIQKGCNCKREIVKKRRDSYPYFNAGLGCFVESRSEEKRMAKRLGLVEAG